ncbi:hypothetical protein BU14_0626s0002, partial [Porphyra umbilicalis]
MALVVDVGYIPLGGSAEAEAEAAAEAADAADAAAAVAAAADGADAPTVDGAIDTEGDADASGQGARAAGAAAVAAAPLDGAPVAAAPTWRQAEADVAAVSMSDAWKALATEIMDAAEAADGKLCHTRLEKAVFLESTDTDTECWVWRDAGRRLLVVAFRGTETVSFKDLLTDAMAWQVPWTPGGPSTWGGGG